MNSQEVFNLTALDDYRPFRQTNINTIYSELKNNPLQASQGGNFVQEKGTGVIFHFHISLNLFIHKFIFKMGKLF